MALHYWDTKEVVKELKEQKITQRDKALYFLLSLILQGLPFGQFLTPETGSRGLYMMIFIIGIAITFAGIRNCHETNSRGDGKDFIDRYFCLSLPVGVRIAAIMLSVLMIGKSIQLMVGHQDESRDNMIAHMLVLIGLTLQMIYYQQINLQLKKFPRPPEET